MSVLSNFNLLVDQELIKARQKHPAAFNSYHEGLAIIQEEFEEFKAEVFERKVDRINLEGELVQLATMCRRFWEDLKLTELE